MPNGHLCTESQWANHPTLWRGRRPEKRKWLRQRAAELVKAELLEPGKPDLPLTEELGSDLAFGREMLGRLRRADEEIVGVLRALDGRYVPPGPGPEPIRNPESVPGGRSLYALNPEEIPTKP